MINFNYPLKNIKSFFKYLYFKKIIPKLFLTDHLIKIFEKSLIFSKYTRKILYDTAGFWYLSPMPSDEQLNFFYENFFWEKKFTFNSYSRDLNQLRLLKKNFFDNSNEKKNILIFGGGQSNLIFLLSAMDHNVTAVDPFKHPHLPNEINYYTNIFDNKLLPHSYDLIISSHSLEHVNNLQNVQSRFYYLLKNLGFLFIDVPNGYNEAAKSGDLGEACHLYFFEKKYFYNLNYKIHLLDLFCEDKDIYEGALLINNIEFDSIRFLGQKIN
jgi:hypothetical protein